MDTFILSFQIRVPFIGLRGRILVNLYWKTFRQKVLKNTEEFLMHDVHFEIPPADFLSDVDCAKKRRLALFDTPASKKCHQEKEIVSCLVTGEESIKIVKERSSGDNIFDAERQVFSKNSDGTVKRSVIKETYARATLRMLNVGCRL